MVKSAIIVDLNFDNHKSYHNDEMITHLINVNKIKYNNPHVHVCAKINSNFFKNNEKMFRILTSIYDRVIESNYSIHDIQKKYKYDQITEFDKHIHTPIHTPIHIPISIHSSSINLDNESNTNYHFYRLKKDVGPYVRNSLLFKEKDIDIMMNGGFNFDKKKIKYNNQSEDPKIKVICNLYHTDCKSIKHQHIDYYHLNSNTQYRPFHLTPMFDDIKEYDYVMPYKILSEYYDNDTYYEKIYNDIKNLIVEDKKRLNLYDSINPIDRDAIMLQYIKCRKDCFMISIWKPAISGLNKFIDYLESVGNIYYVKTISFTKKALRNLLFWMYDDFTYTARLEFIEKKLDYIDTLDENNEATFILFDNVMGHKLAGQGSSFKTELRAKLLEFANLDTKKYRGNDVIHINDYFYQTIEYSQIILNDNTLDMIGHQDCRMFIKDELYLLTNLKIQTFRKIIYSNLSLLEIDRMIIMGGYVLYSYGIRPFTDVDAFVIKNADSDKSTRLISFVETNFVIEDSKLYFCDMGIQGSKYWRESWDIKNQKVYDFFNLANSAEMILDPKNFCFNQGFKVTTIDYEIIRKLMRNRTQDHVDLIMMSIIDEDLIKKYLEPKTEHHGDDLNKYFNISDEAKLILGEYQENSKKKWSILHDKYSKNSINMAKNNDLFKAYFQNLNSK